MPNCNIIACSVRKGSSHQNITLHMLPTDEKKRKKWLETIGVENINMSPKRIHICSLHFEKSCFNRTLNIKVTLRDDAIPSRKLLPAGQSNMSSIFNENEEKQTNNARLKVCRICLVMDAKLVSMSTYKLEQAYENLTGSCLSKEDKLPEMLCMECAQRLLNFSRFRLKSLRANTLMLFVIKKQDCLTVQNIKTINRLNNHLTSSLSTKHFGVNHYDSYIEYEDQPSLIQDDSPTTATRDEDNEIVSKVQILESDDELNDPEVNDPGFDDDGITDVVNEKNDDSDKEYVLCGKDDYSSDDSIPLEKCEIKNARKGKVKDDEPVKTAKRVKNIIKDPMEPKTNRRMKKDLLKFSTTDTIDADNEIVSKEEISDKSDDGLNEPEVYYPGFDDDDITDTDVLNEKNDDSDKEYVLCGKDDYSSDDSLPLEKCDTEKARKRKEKDDKPAKTPKRVKNIIKDPMEPKINRRMKNFLNFTVTYLTVEEQIAEIVKRQESSQYKNAGYKCTVCFKGFTDEEAYNSHMARHTNQCGEHECEICKLHFKTPRALRKHLTSRHVRRFNCKQCTYETMQRSAVPFHEQWHKGTIYKCPHCPEEFIKSTSYFGHIRIKHPSDFVCGLCGYSFVSAKGIELHKKLKHRLDNVQIPEDGPLCELCNVRFISSEAHQTHLKVSPKHNTDSPEPNSAHSKVRRKYEYNKEFKRSFEKGPVTCEECGLLFDTPRGYFCHLGRKHPEKILNKKRSMCSIMCEVCGMMFENNFFLQMHKSVHTGERPFKCDSCDKSFRIKQSLMIHKRIHSDDRVTYECKVCGKHFSNIFNRRRHMLIHTGIKPYECQICGNTFKSAAEKTSHIDHKHLKKPWPKRVRGKRRPKPKQVEISPKEQEQDMEIGDIEPMIEDETDYYILKVSESASESEAGSESEAESIYES